MVSCDFASFCPHDNLSRDSWYQGDRETQRLKDAHRFSAEMTPRRARWHPDYSTGQFRQQRGTRERRDLGARASHPQRCQPISPQRVALSARHKLDLHLDHEPDQSLASGSSAIPITDVPAARHRVCLLGVIHEGWGEDTNPPHTPFVPSPSLRLRDNHCGLTSTQTKPSFAASRATPITGALSAKSAVPAPLASCTLIVPSGRTDPSAPAVKRVPAAMALSPSATLTCIGPL